MPHPRRLNARHFPATHVVLDDLQEVEALGRLAGRVATHTSLSGDAPANASANAPAHGPKLCCGCAGAEEPLALGVKALRCLVAVHEDFVALVELLPRERKALRNNGSCACL